MNTIETKNGELQVFRSRKPEIASGATVPPPSSALHTHDGAQATLIKLILMYPEREEWIRAKYHGYVRSYDLSIVESLISDEIEPMVPQILEERAERERRIRDPETRNSVVLLTDFDSDLKKSLDEMDATLAALAVAKVSEDSAQFEFDAAKARLEMAKKKSLASRRKVFPVEPPPPQKRGGLFGLFGKK